MWRLGQGGAGGGGGGSGASGGIVWISAKTITFTGVLEAKGGNGGNGGDGRTSSVNCGLVSNGDGGGGGSTGSGGNGGVVIVTTTSAVPPYTTDLTGGSAGVTPGIGGTGWQCIGAVPTLNPAQDGLPGTTGNPGNGGKLYEIILT
jgi:hypothetical protein